MHLILIYLIRFQRRQALMRNEIDEDPVANNGWFEIAKKFNR